VKHLKRILFVISYCVYGTVFAMEIVPAQECSWIVDVDNKSIENLVGGTIHYYDEYESSMFRKDTVCFPVESTDPLPIQYCGDQRFFVTSAIHFSSWMVPGQVYAITDPAIKQLVAVRGDVKSYDSRISACRVHLYLGLETDRVKHLNENHKRIYPARVMAFEMRQQRDDEVGYRYEANYMPGTEPFEGALLMEEVKKQNPQVEICAQTTHFLKPLVVDLLGKENAEHFDSETLQFNFTKRYWSKKKST
jgi:hypothetical protein